MGRWRRQPPACGRLFDQGELRILTLALIAEDPSHGTEPIKTVEMRSF